MLRSEFIKNEIRMNEERLAYMKKTGDAGIHATIDMAIDSTERAIKHMKDLISKNIRNDYEVNADGTKKQSKEEFEMITKQKQPTHSPQESTN